MSFTTPWIPSGTPWPPVDPYITVSEYKAAGTSVDTSQLVPGGTDFQQDVALARRILQASSWADQICDQTLAATVDVETKALLRVNSSGCVLIPLKFWPVLEVQAVSVGVTPSTMVPITDTTNLFMAGRKILSVPVVGQGSAQLTNSWLTAGPAQPGAKVYTQVTYVNGWANGILAASTNVGATSFTLDSTVGFIAGRQYTIVDPAAGDETFTCTSVTANTNTIGCSPLVYAHTKPGAPDAISVSGLPPSAKNATVELTSGLIRTRGVLSLEMLSMGAQPRTEIGIEDGAMVNFQLAVDLLDKLRRVSP